MSWKKMALGFGITVLAFVAFILGGGLLMDPEATVSTEADLAASPEAVHPLMSSPAGVQAWWKDFHEELPGGESMPAMDIPILEGPTEGVGSRVAFEVDGVRWEEWTLVELVPPGKVVWEVAFQDFMVTQRRLEVVPGESGGSHMIWSETASIGNPLYRWMRVFMPPSKLIENFQQAMRLLDKRALERSPSPDPPAAQTESPEAVPTDSPGADTGTETP